MFTDEYMAYPSERAIAFLQKKKMPWQVYGSARSCKAALIEDYWIPDDKDGKDVILFPVIQNDEVVNIVAIEPAKPLKLYLRDPDNNLWSLLDLIAGLQAA